ncbi:MAG: hypothetical protein IPM54_13390 [Polyangiaceae bacterium]|nr:hypothetical protein [Polyangiaceae bacterium]
MINDDPTMEQLADATPLAQKLRGEPNPISTDPEGDALAVIAVGCCSELAAYYGRPVQELRRSEILAWIRTQRPELEETLQM